MDVYVRICMYVCVMGGRVLEDGKVGIILQIVLDLCTDRSLQ